MNNKWTAYTDNTKSRRYSMCFYVWYLFVTTWKSILKACEVESNNLRIIVSYSTTCRNRKQDAKSRLYKKIMKTKLIYNAKTMFVTSQSLCICMYKWCAFIFLMLLPKFFVSISCRSITESFFGCIQNATIIFIYYDERKENMKIRSR